MPADGSAAQARLPAALADALRLAQPDRDLIDQIIQAENGVRVAAADYDGGGQPGRRSLRAEANASDGWPPATRTAA